MLCVASVTALAGCIAFKSLTDGYAFAPPPDASTAQLRVLILPDSAAGAWRGARGQRACVAARRRGRGEATARMRRPRARPWSGVARQPPWLS